MNDIIEINVVYLSFEYQNEFFSKMTDGKRLVKLVEKYLSCKWKDRWDENIIIIHVKFRNIQLSISRKRLDNHDKYYLNILDLEDKTVKKERTEVTVAQVINEIKSLLI